MSESRVVAAGLVLAVGVAAVASVLTGSQTVLGVTPLGVAVYLAIGIGAPQFVLARRLESPLRLGLAVLAVGAGALALVIGLSTGTVTQPAGPGVATILLLVVFGVLVGAVLREFRAGYRSSA